MTKRFQLHADFSPEGDQPKAIAALSEGIERGVPHQVLLGVTGSGKTFTLANVIEKIQRPTLVMAHNKTLAAQLYREFKDFFPENAVEYFVSYYDYYQPEAYIPHTDTYIEKDASINDAIDRMRHAATSSLFGRNDIIVVASVSCIYGLGSPEAYHGLLLYLVEGDTIERDAVLAKLVEIRYTRNDVDFYRGTFRVRGDVVEVFPAASEDTCIRIEFFGDRVEALYRVDPLCGTVLERIPKIAIYPTSHYVIPKARIEKALADIEAELEERIPYFRKANLLVEAQRIDQRTMFDLEMIREVGYCQGIENYSRHLSGRAPGEPPPTLMDYFPKDYLLIIDESHATIPQIGGMYAGDRARKVNLVEHGFRLPSAFDNRPLTFEEFERFVHRAIYVSATPGPYELKKAGALHVVEQIVRPTGLTDPEVTVAPAQGQVDHLLTEIRKRVERSERTLVTTLTKRMAEDLTEYYREIGLRVQYLHSDVETLARSDLLRELRLGSFDVLIGINLLREGLDLPEVSLVAILDADKEGFLRSQQSLIQTAGRASRHIAGTVILYADRVTGSMQRAIQEMNRRRALQQAYNQAHGIIPCGVQKAVPARLYPAEESPAERKPDRKKTMYEPAPTDPKALGQMVERLERDMRLAAKRLAFEEAAALRDQIKRLQEKDLGLVL